MVSDLCLHLSSEDCSRNKPKSHFINGIKNLEMLAPMGNEENLRCPFAAPVARAGSAADAAGSRKCNWVHDGASVGAGATFILGTALPATESI